MSRLLEVPFEDLSNIADSWQTNGSPRILLLDDELDLWWTDNVAGLTEAGYDVDTAEDGDDGWRAIQSRNYDLLITDNKMPKLSGLQLIRRLRSTQNAIPVILASSLLPVDAERQRRDLQITAMLEKPLSPAKLLRAVKAALEVPEPLLVAI